MAAHAYSQEYLPGRETAWRRNPEQFVAMQAGHFVSGIADARRLDGLFIIMPDNNFFGINVTLQMETAGENFPSEKNYVLSQRQLILKPK